MATLSQPQPRITLFSSRPRKEFFKQDEKKLRKFLNLDDWILKGETR
jgi:hypothetical protein